MSSKSVSQNYRKQRLHNCSQRATQSFDSVVGKVVVPSYLLCHRNSLNQELYQPWEVLKGLV